MNSCCQHYKMQNLIATSTEKFNGSDIALLVFDIETEQQ
jgi:hypothetical protein